MANLKQAEVREGQSPVYQGWHEGLYVTTSVATTEELEKGLRNGTLFFKASADKKSATAFPVKPLNESYWKGLLNRTNLVKPTDTVTIQEVVAKIVLTEADFVEA